MHYVSGAVNMHSFVWEFVFAIYDFQPSIHS